MYAPDYNPKAQYKCKNDLRSSKTFSYKKYGSLVESYKEGIFYFPSRGEYDFLPPQPGRVWIFKKKKKGYFLPLTINI